MSDGGERFRRRQLARLLRASWIASRMAVALYCGHAGRRRAPGLTDRFREYAAAQGERRRGVEAALAAVKIRGPLLRPFWALLSWFWGRLTGFASDSFSLHMLANVEHECAKVSEAAGTLATEAGCPEVGKGLLEQAVADRARKSRLADELRAVVGVPEKTS